MHPLALGFFVFGLCANHGWFDGHDSDDYVSRLLRGNMQAFLDQSSEITEIAGRMATRPLQALKQAGEAQSAR